MRPCIPHLKSIRCFLCVIIFFSCLVFIPDASAENVTIICNKSVPETNLSKSDLRNIFLGKKRGWEDDNPVTIVTLKEGEAHDRFCMKYTRKSSMQFKSYWRYMQFTGKGQIPKSCDSEKEMIDSVATTKGAIGYISSEQKPVNVKILSIQ